MKFNPFSKDHKEGQQAHFEAPGAEGEEKVNVAYFVNWGIYARKYFPKDVPVEHLTHLLYAFADVRQDTGEVFLTDKWADEDIHYDGDSWNDQGTLLFGNFKQLALLKHSNRKLKLLLSIGGWTFSSHFPSVASSPSSRSNFVKSSIELLENYGLDGLDVDWEYPKDPNEAENYVSLLKELREGLDECSRKRGQGNGKFLLTIAAPCGKDHYEKLKLKEMDRYLDFWNLMAYDYSGGWDSVAGHQANLHGPSPSTETAVQHYVSSGVPSNKLVIGLPLYGRAFENTDGIGKPFSGIGEGSWEAGNWDYKSLPLQGSKEHFDQKLGSTYSYDEAKRKLISYDSPDSVKMKLDWIKQKGLKGSMFWELSGDAKGERGLVEMSARQLGMLDSSLNTVDYPHSKFENMRSGFKS